MKNHKQQINTELSSIKPPQKRWGIIRMGILLIIRLYQKSLSGIMGGQCRFYPTCSSYAILAFEYLPLYKAFYVTIFRIGRCNPYGKGGFDYPNGVPIPKDVEKHIDKKSCRIE